MKRLVASCAGLALLSLGACADNTPGGKAAHERHEHFEQIGDAFKDLTDELKHDTPDVATLRSSAGKIATLAPQVRTWFPPGSGPQDGKKTHALAAAWTKPAELQQAAQKLVDASAQMRTAADSGDVNAVRAQVKPLGDSCKGCHDKFREKD
jgi:cytochrome c556